MTIHKRSIGFLTVLIFLFLTLSVQARPVRVIMLDFTDETGGSADAALI